MFGSFMPFDEREAYDEVKSILQERIEDVFNHTTTNFFNARHLGELTVNRGDNILPTCFQYAIKNDEGLKLMTVKIYDKVMDLVSRDGSAIVGSKINVILGSKHNLTSFETMVARAEYTGVTRLEVSIHSPTLINHIPTAPGYRKIWY